jgi:predicted metalloprotease with PDZ domain
MMDVVSHEFFHIVTHHIHSKEIQDFDYNDPKMSHLWMYEGVTEYFANLSKSIKG